MNNFKLVIKKNTSELRNLLDNLGYYYFSSIDRINSNGYIYITDFKYYIVFDTPANCIDCGEDEELFLKYLYRHTVYYIKTNNKKELTTYQKAFLKSYNYAENSIYGCLNLDNNNLPVEKLDGEFSLCFSDNFIKDDDELITEQLNFILSDLSKDFKDKYKDKVVFIDEIPIEKQKEFIKCFKINDKDTINTTLEIIINDYSKDKIEIINPPITTINEEEILNFKYHLNNNVNIYYDNIKSYRKNHFHTTKHKPDKKSKKAARRNNRRAKRNNR